MLKEENYKVIHDKSLNAKHNCNDVILNSNVNCANNIQNPKLGDANFPSPQLVAMIMSGVSFLMILNIYLSLEMDMFAIIL